MTPKITPVSSGVPRLDQFLGGLFLGDNVIWYDDSGSQAALFGLKLIEASEQQGKSLIYVSFDRSPKNLLDLLGPLAESQSLTILDCFTHGKGDGSQVFSKFYEKDGAQWPYQVIRVNDPRRPDQVMDAVYNPHKTMKGDVRFIFESLTGMVDLWGGEDQVQKVYTHACPRLYELETIAYWVIARGAHSNRLKANINQIAQVVIELGIKRGKSSLTIVKAEKRGSDSLNTPHTYWNEGLAVAFEGEKRGSGWLDLGLQLKLMRSRQGLSQKQLAHRVGVTPSSISQMENNQIYPSLPALFKIAEVLGVEVGSFFQKPGDERSGLLLSDDQGVAVSFPDLPKGSISGIRLSPLDPQLGSELYLIDIAPGQKLPSHFFRHKGEEFGYLLTGELHTLIKTTRHTLLPGTVLYINAEPPSQWDNPTTETARLLWVNLR